MALYAIGDLHLSLGADKPMDVFGGPWENYVEKIKLGFSSLHDDDVCVLCGDLAWGMTMEQALPDFQFIEALPGKKILLNVQIRKSNAVFLQGFLDDIQGSGT